MQSHEYRAMLLETIDLYLENTPQSLSRANLLRKTGIHSLAFTTINDIIWRGFFTELKDVEYVGSREFLLERQQDLLGVSRHYFHAYVGNDYTERFSEEELQAFDFLQDAVNWLSSLKGAQSEDDEHYAEIQRRLRSYRSLYPPADEVYNEKIPHFIIKMIASIVGNIDVPSRAFAQHGYLTAMPSHLIGSRIEVGEPSLAQDFAWSQNALLSLQGQSWISFHWQFLPTNIVFTFS